MPELFTSIYLEEYLNNVGQLKPLIPAEKPSLLEVVQKVIELELPLRFKHTYFSSNLSLFEMPNGNYQELFTLLYEYGVDSHTLAPAILYFLREDFKAIGELTVESLKKLITAEALSRIEKHLKEVTFAQEKDSLAREIIGNAYNTTKIDLTTWLNSNQAMSLRQMVVIGAITIEQEAELEKWVIKRLSLTAEERKYLFASRIEWLHALQGSPEEEEPTDEKYLEKKVIEYYEDQPLKALRYFALLPVTKRSRTYDLAMSLLQHKLPEQAQELLTSLKYDLQSENFSPEERKGFFAPVIPVAILLGDATELLSCLDFYNSEGLKNLCQELGVDQSQFAQIVFTTVFEENRILNKKTLLRKTGIFDVLLEHFEHFQNTLPANLTREYISLLRTRIYLFGKTGVNFGNSISLEEDRESVIFFARLYSLDNNQAEFKKWMQILDRITSSDEVAEIFNFPARLYTRSKKE